MSVKPGQAQVVLCGHSYGGQVITAAGCDLPGIAHLVYVATLALDVGETMREWMMKRPGSRTLQLTTFDDGTDLPQGWGDDDGRYTPDALARIRTLRPRPMVGIRRHRSSEPHGAKFPALSSSPQRIP